MAQFPITPPGFVDEHPNADLKKHFLRQTGLGYGGETDLHVYAIVFLAIVAFVSGYFLF
jgi:hypothetical protein